MITIQDMLKLKEQELAKLQKEIDALRLVANMYGETALIDAARQAAEAAPPVFAHAQPSPGIVAQMFTPAIAVAAPIPAPTPIPVLARNGGEKRFP